MSSYISYSHKPLHILIEEEYRKRIIDRLNGMVEMVIF